MIVGREIRVIEYKLKRWCKCRAKAWVRECVLVARVVWVYKLFFFLLKLKVVLLPFISRSK